MNPELKYMARIECDWAAASDWCKEHVGEFNQDWIKLGIDPAASVFGDYTTTWYFKDQKKLVEFLLRWA